MQLFVGLGNPGGKYAGHRHNIGFRAVDAIAGAHGFGPWRRKFQAEVAEGRFGGDKVLLVKPQTFMNLSGQSVGEAMRYLKVSPEDLWVFHDELDLVPGKLRVKQGGGHAGHNGLRSLHQHVGAEYNRVRLGIGHPGHKDLVSPYVLHDFARADRDWLDPLLAAVGREAARLAAGDAPGFMNAVALAIRPPERPAPRPTAAGRKGGGAGKAVEIPAENSEPESVLAKLLARFSRK
ncbi:MAG: aminoacyl-tRNA hydrolase [Thermohalobaculum sp.]